MRHIIYQSGAEKSYDSATKYYLIILQRGHVYWSLQSPVIKVLVAEIHISSTLLCYILRRQGPIVINIRVANLGPVHLSVHFVRLFKNV